MTDTCQIALTYRGVLNHRGVGIARESYGKSWTLRLANGVWTLTDHTLHAVHSFSQRDLHQKVAFPGFARGYPDVYLVGLGPRIHCFEPEHEVLGVLRHYVRQSERVNAPYLARWHRMVGLGLLGLAVLCLAGCAVALSWALKHTDHSGSLRLGVGLTLIPSGLVSGVYYAVVGIRGLRKSHHFARMAAASAPAAGTDEQCSSSR